jgi:hypothetical protein
MNDSGRSVDFKPSLVFLSGELIAVPIPLEREEVILGRALEAEIRVNDTQCSRQHARITTGPNPESRATEYVLHDLDSRNGTFLNGRRIRREALENGDKITIGDTILRFDLLDEIDQEYQRQIHRLISQTTLPGLFRVVRSFQICVVRRAARVEGWPFCVLMMDGDNFKSVNDTYGHLTGSKTSRRSASR